MKIRISKITVIGAAIVCLGLGLMAREGLSQQRSSLKQFMRQKLEHSQNILEGLTKENYQQIGNHAKQLRDLSEDAQWRVSPDLTYIRMSTEFQELAGELVTKAREKNLDGSTLSYLKVTMKCVECHKLVRDQRLAMIPDDAK